MAEEVKELLRPQPKQWEFLSCPADIVLYGGAAGAGKTLSVVIEALRNISNPEYNGVIFRRTSPEIKNPGGLWDESSKIYPLVGGDGAESRLTWKFPSGAKILFSHMERESDKEKWQGSAIPFMAWEELTHFSRGQFTYMLSRSRSMSGIRPYIRATCNPDADSWVAELIAWWIGEDGYIIPERSGVIRYFTVKNDEFIWGDTPEEVVDLCGGDRKPEEIKSFTFISAKLSDNQKLLEVNPEYEGNLKALSHVEQERLLHGNWKIRPAAGLYFKDEDFQVIEPNQVPPNVRWCRSWDFAGTADTENNQADRTAKVKMGRCKDTGRIIIADAEAYRKSTFDVEQDLLKTAERDGKLIEITIPQDPGQAGKAQARQMVAKLAGYNVRVMLPQGDKESRAKGMSAQAGGGNVYIVQGDWNKEYIKEMVNFPDSKLKDLVDASSDAFNHLCDPSVEWAFYEKDENGSYLD